MNLLGGEVNVEEMAAAMTPKPTVSVSDDWKKK